LKLLPYPKNMSKEIILLEGVATASTVGPYSLEDRDRMNWITKAGKKVKVPDLDDKHVSNIIAAMQRGDIKCDKSLQDFFELELAHRENNR